MTTDLCGEDVIVRLSSPQILSTETIVTGNASAPQTHTQPGARAAAAGMEFGRRLLLAARAGDCNTVLELMAKGAPFTTDWLGTSPLHLSAANNHVETCAVLLRAGVSCDSRTKVERTPLHLAAHAGHTNVVSLLLQHGAMVDCRDMLRMTPLHWAAAQGHLAVARELLRHGADPRARCKFRKTPRCLAARHQRLDVLALLEATALQEQMSDETPKVLQEFDTIQKMEVVKPTEKETTQPEKTIIIESKTEPVPISINAATVGASVGAGAARARRAEADAESGAALLRAHGITLLPADKGSTLLTALRSGRTVVLSDAGKLMLKESGNTRLSEPLLVDTHTEVTSESPNLTTSAPITVNHASGSVSVNRNVVVRARAVRSVRGAKNVKLVTLNKPDQTFKKVINPSDLQQVKLVQVSPADKDNKNTMTRPALKLLLNKANLTRLLASTTNTPTPMQQAPLTLSTIQQTQDISTDSLMDTTESTQDITMEENDNIVRIPEQFVKSSSIKYLRSQLLTAHAAIANLTAELRLCKAKLAKYENQQ